MIAAVRIASIALYLFRWNEDVLPVLSPLGEDAPIDVLDFSRMTVCVVAAAGPRVIQHLPGRVEFFVKELILDMMVARSVILSGFLRLD